MNDSNVNILPEHIRANLAKCQSHQQMLCLECGYDGLVGVVNESREYKWAWFMPFILLSLYGIYEVFNPHRLYSGGFVSNVPPIWLFLIFGLLAGVFGIAVKKTFLCPNCERELHKK